MSKGLGNNYLLWIESATPGTYTAIKGQGALIVNRGSSSVDLSDKNNYPYGTSAPGLRTLTIDLDMIPDLPDTLGYTRAETLCSAVPQLPFNIQIRKGGTAGATPGDVVFAASMYGALTTTNFGENAALTSKLQLSLAAAPTTDTLAV